MLNKISDYLNKSKRKLFSMLSLIIGLTENVTHFLILLSVSQAFHTLFCLYSVPLNLTLAFITTLKMLPT